MLGKQSCLMICNQPIKQGCQGMRRRGRTRLCCWHVLEMMSSLEDNLVMLCRLDKISMVKMASTIRGATSEVGVEFNDFGGPPPTVMITCRGRQAVHEADMQMANSPLTYQPCMLLALLTGLNSQLECEPALLAEVNLQLTYQPHSLPMRRAASPI